MQLLSTHLLLLFFLVATTMAGCRREPPAPIEPPPRQEPAPPEPVEPPSPPEIAARDIPATPGTTEVVDEEEEADIEALLDEATTRQRCNIVMGCPAAAAIIALGEDAIAPIIARYQAAGSPNYQKFHLLDLLGRIGSETALPVLRAELQAQHWEARTRSARAIGRIGARHELARLKTHLAQTEGRQDYAFRYALAFAVEALDGKGGANILLEALAPQSINGRNWGYTRVAVEAAAELQLKGACALLRLAVEHRDVFLKKAAIVATGTLQCEDPPLHHAIAAQLPSRIPSVRRQSTRTLKRLTGLTFNNFEQWQSYQTKSSATASP